MSKTVAHLVHHTHWDPEWYFTEEDTTVMFAYNTKELLQGFEKGNYKYFLMDGRTDALETYIQMHPEDEEKIKSLISEGRLIVGPFHAQLDCFISSGEAVVNNLRLGTKLANRWGKSGRVAYLPDSFGHSQDFPKIFNSMGIQDFVFRRGKGDEHNLGLDFYWESNDGSKLLATTMDASYGFATHAYVSGDLITDPTLEYYGDNVQSQMQKLKNGSAMENDFLLTMGEDLTPAVQCLTSMAEKYNKESEEFEFIETTLQDYMNKLRAEGKGIKTFQGELLSTQYHRVHKSLFSARADIKALQDKIERIMTFEVQPLMSMLDQLGVDYDTGLIDRVWNLLLCSQTHSSATNTDKTNELIKIRSQRSYNIAESTKVYLIRKVAVSIPQQENQYPLVIFNSLPETRNLCQKLDVFTKSTNFKILLDGKEVPHTVLAVSEHYSGKIRKNPDDMFPELWFNRSRISINLEQVPGLSYKTLTIVDGATPEARTEKHHGQSEIENDRYKISVVDGKLNIFDKAANYLHSDVLYIEESGDEGDNYDYSYPTDDMILKYDFADAKVVDCVESVGMRELVLQGSIKTPFDLTERADQKLTTELTYRLHIELKDSCDVIRFHGTLNNQAHNHRVRLAIRTKNASKHSVAGTQYGYIERETSPEALKFWKEEGWLEEPTPTEPLLNHVSLIGNDYVATTFTRGMKEYEIIGENFTDIAMTAFRSVGHLGLPDLNRRPGRASGLQMKMFEAPQSQMIGENGFDFGLCYYPEYDGNIIAKDYVTFATDISYYQNQNLERVVFPMCFLDTYPLEQGVPTEFCMFELVGSEGVIGSVKKSEDNSGYILRVYNNESKPVQGGCLKINLPYQSIEVTNLAESNRVATGLELGELKAGELRNILITL